MTLASYRSHKIVMAGAIAGVTRNADNTAIVSLNVLGIDGTPETITELQEKLFTRYDPGMGDYFIVYPPDNYQSISPKQQFEDGYHLLTVEAAAAKEGPQRACNLISWAVHNLIMPEDKADMARSVLAELEAAGITPTEA